MQDPRNGEDDDDVIDISDENEGEDEVEEVEDADKSAERLLQEVDDDEGMDEDKVDDETELSILNDSSAASPSGEDESKEVTTATLAVPIDKAKSLGKAGSSSTSSAVKNGEGDEDDIIEIIEADPLAEAEDELEDEEKLLEDSDPNSLNSSIASDSESKQGTVPPILIKDTKSLANLASNSKIEAVKEPTLVIIDTNSILSGRGPIPVQKSAGGSPLLASQIRSSQLNCYETMSKPSSVKIPDDAFLIEAPSFIVPYVFEQNGKSSMKTIIKELDEAVKKESKEKAEANGEVYEDKAVPEKKKSEDYFESPVGKLLMNVGMNLVQEFVQVDLLKMQKRKAEKEKSKSRIGFVPMQTQQSIISLKNNIEESKENNEPFRHRMKKCELCNFKTESALVMSAHLETPHMRNYSYRCNFCPFTTREPHAILYHMETEHSVKPRLERAPAYHQCPSCPFEDNSKAKLTRHLLGCAKRFKIEKNLDPPLDWDTPAKLPKLPKNRLMPQGNMNQFMSAPSNQQRSVIAYSNMANKYIQQHQQQQLQQQQQQQAKMNLPPLLQAPKKTIPGLVRTVPKIGINNIPTQLQRAGMMMRTPVQMAGQMISQSHLQLGNNQILQQVVSGQLAAGSSPPVGGFLSKLGLVSNSMGTGTLQKSASSQPMRNVKSSSQPSISITPLPRQSASPAASAASQAKPQAKTSFVICEICDGYIKDLDQLRNHMQWIHKVKIHPKMIYNKPPLNCQKCQFRFFTDQGLERHLLGSHGLVTSSMQDAANKGQDNGRCPLCGKVYQWKLLAHVAKDHNVTLKPAHLSYKCTVCTATFGMYKLFESHVYSAHSMNAKRNDRRPQPPQNPVNNNRGNQMQVTSRSISTASQNSFRPMKINDEITIIPQPMANNTPLRNKGSLTITPQSSSTRRSMRANEDEGIQIIEIDEAPSKSSNGRNPKENGEFLSRLPISDSILRKRNLEISVCGTDSDNNSSADESFQREPSMKRLRHN